MGEVLFHVDDCCRGRYTSKEMRRRLDANRELHQRLRERS